MVSGCVCALHGTELEIVRGYHWTRERVSSVENFFRGSQMVVWELIDADIQHTCSTFTPEVCVNTACIRPIQSTFVHACKNCHMTNHLESVQHVCLM